MKTLMRLASGGYSRPLANDLGRARQELALNPTIMVYEILDDGYELRGPASPSAQLRTSYERLGAGYAQVQRAFIDLGDALKGDRL